MDPQDRRRGIGRRFIEVGGVRAVCRSHFPQPCAALLNDVGDTERAADLDQLAARDDHFLSGGNGREKEQRAGGVVVGQHCRFAAEQRAAQLRQVLVAPSSGAFIEVELEIRVVGRDGGGTRPERGIDRRAPKVRVDDDAGAVDHRPQRRFRGDVEPCANVAGRRALLEQDPVPTNGLQVETDGVLHPLAAELRDHVPQRLAGENPLDGRDAPQ